MKTLQIPLDNFMGILNEIKNLKSDIVCIHPNQFYNSLGTPFVYGIFGNSVLVQLSYSAYSASCCGRESSYPLYNEGPYSIMLETRLINPWIKLYKDSLTAVKKTNKEINKLYLETNISIDYDTIWNTNVGRVARYSSYTTPEYCIPLFYRDRYNIIYQNMQNEIKSIIQANKGTIEYDNIDITNETEFNQIMSLKAADGGVIWSPSFLKKDGKIKYCLTLASNMLNISKGDLTRLSIYDIEYSPTFITKFTVEKPKKKITLDYYIKYFKL